MSISLRKHASKLIAATLAVSAMASVSAAALEQPVAVLSSNLNSSVGTVLTSDQITTAEQALAKAKAEAEAKAKAEAEAKAKAEAEAAKKAAAQDAYNKLLTDPVAAKTVSYSSSLLATDAIKSNATSLGNYKLTFYCPCATCNGVAGAPLQPAGAGSCHLAECCGAHPHRPTVFPGGSGSHLVQRGHDPKPAAPDHRHSHPARLPRKPVLTKKFRLASLPGGIFSFICREIPACAVPQG